MRKPKHKPTEGPVDSVEAKGPPRTIADVRQEIEAFYAGIDDLTAKLGIAAYYGDASFAIEAIKGGADVNAVHVETGMTPIHLAAGGGFNSIVEAILEDGGCDLTIRDPQGRLPSDCAAYAAEDFALAERLAMIEAEQFHQTGRDPRIGHYVG